MVDINNTGYRPVHPVTGKDVAYGQRPARLDSRSFREDKSGIDQTTAEDFGAFMYASEATSLQKTGIIVKEGAVVVTNKVAGFFQATGRAVIGSITSVTQLLAALVSATRAVLAGLGNAASAFAGREPSFKAKVLANDALVHFKSVFVEANPLATLREAVDSMKGSDALAEAIKASKEADKNSYQAAIRGSRAELAKQNKEVQNTNLALSMVEAQVQKAYEDKAAVVGRRQTAQEQFDAYVPGRIMGRANPHQATLDDLANQIQAIEQYIAQRNTVRTSLLQTLREKEAALDARVQEEVARINQAAK